jgi:hypothetical protein
MTKSMYRTLRLEQFVMFCYLVALPAFLIGGLVYRHVSALDTPALCDMVDATTTAKKAFWDARYGYYDEQPADLVNVTTLYLDDPRYTQPGQTRAYILLYSAAKSELWIVPMWSMAPSQEPPGFACAPRKFTVEDRHGVR